MANRIFLLCLIILCVTVSCIESKGRGGGRGGGRSMSSSHHGSGSRSGGFINWLGSIFKSKPSPAPTGSRGSHSYPPASGGLSGTHGSSSSGGHSGSHNYPPSGGLSGSGTRNYNPSGYKPHITSYTPSYYSAPQYVYVHEYRHSDSRFGDLLTGLSLYNMGRSHGHYHSHYYHDDYYRRRYDSSDSSHSSQSKQADEATCLLRVKENDKVEVLKIPCEIVSTFTEGSKRVTPTAETQVNRTVCTTNSTMINSTVPVNGYSMNSTVSTNATMVNVTVCTTNSTALDPLTVKGPPVDAKNMSCVVEIHTKDALFTHKIDCNTLMSFAKMSEPKRDVGILPSRTKLTSWLSKPPWWMSIFIAV